MAPYLLLGLDATRNLEVTGMLGEVLAPPLLTHPNYLLLVARMLALLVLLVSGQ